MVRALGKEPFHRLDEIRVWCSSWQAPPRMLSSQHLQHEAPHCV